MRMKAEEETTTAHKMQRVYSSFEDIEGVIIGILHGIYYLNTVELTKK